LLFRKMSIYMSFHKSLNSHSCFFFYLFLSYFALFGGVLYYVNSPVNFLEKGHTLNEKKKKKALEIPANIFPLSSLSLPSNLGLSDKFQITSFEPRPDEGKKEKYFEVTLLSDNSSKVALPNEKIFLYYDQNLKFAAAETDFYLKLASLNKDVVKVTAIGAYKTLDGRDKINETSFEVKILEPANSSLSEEEDFLSLKKAIFLGPDLSLDLLDKTESHRQLNRLIFLSKNTLYVKEGDILVYKDNKWKLKEEEDTTCFSLAKISLCNSSLNIDFWKKGEIKKKVIILNKSLPATTLRAGDDFITELNIRTKKQVSCKIDGQRVIVKEKDLLYKKDGLWNKISLTGLENIKDASEFFIFEKLNISPTTKNFIGYLFNNDKTQIVKIEKNLMKKPPPPQQEGKNSSKQKRRR
jgi:hypothetical protein